MGEQGGGQSDVALSPVPPKPLRVPGKFIKNPEDALDWETLFELDVAKARTKCIKVRVMKKGEDLTFDIREFSVKTAKGEGYAGPKRGKGCRFSLDLLPALYNALASAMESQGL